MSATPEMLHRRQQALARLAPLRFDLDEALQLHTIELPAPDPSLDMGQMWAGLLCLIPALDACMRNFNTALGENGPLMDRTRELDQLGSELCRLRLLATRSTGAGSEELKAASKNAVEAFLACMVEWAKAAARAEELDQPSHLTVAYPSRLKPPGHDINDIADTNSYFYRNDRRKEQGSQCCITGLILAFTLGIWIGGD